MIGTVSGSIGGSLLGTAEILAVCFAIERFVPIDRYTLRQRLPGVLMVATGTFLSACLSWPLQQLWGLLGLRFLVVPLGAWLAPLGLLGDAIGVAVPLLLIDFLQYWRHRAEHRWFWPIHKVHHAPTELHAANSIGHPLQVLPDFLMVTIPLSFFQFGGIGVPIAVGFVMSLLTVYIHSPVDFHFGPLRRVVVDNRFHRIHHSLEERHFDRNFGIGFSLWDGLFGTAHWPGPEEWPAVGLADTPPPRTLGAFLKMPFVADRSTEPSPRGDPRQPEHSLRA